MTDLEISTPNVAASAAIASEVLCLGTHPIPQGRAVRSLLPAGAVLASATIAADHTVAHQDGHWIASVTDSAASHDVRFVQGTFTKPPHCTCNSVTTAAAACISSTGATVDHVVVGSFTAAGAATATDVAIVCVGE